MAVGSSADSRPPRAWRSSSQPTQARLASLSANLGFAASTTSSATDSGDGIVSRVAASTTTVTAAAKRGPRASTWRAVW